MASTTTKEKVLGCLQTIKNNYALTQAGILLLAAENAPDTFEECYAHISGHPEAQQFAYIKYIFNDYELLKHSSNELRKSVLRNCLKETFEMLKVELVTDEEKEILLQAPWYRFLRMVRNSLSHDFKFRFRDYDKPKLPVSWSNLTITIEMDNEFLPMAGFLTRAKVQQLLEEVFEYIRTNIR
ncbi:MAG: hypothetical protein CVU57_09930 [Deltaproteobacteria bacterium HGW-Deltaproteobacteria-15]|jgi:hypothetical protein|nr:MAG: hypothetical protein CVU57_09930 [Deltaproteobacteria bacterium HGW-Deltaproteobacteria-15]